MSGTGVYRLVNGNKVELSPEELKEKRQEDEERHKKTMSEMYKEIRMDLYPSIKEQLDMIYWDKKNATTKWEESIDWVKGEIPKEFIYTDDFELPERPF